MKKTNLFLSLAFAALAFVACSDNDKKDDPKPDPKTEVAKELYVNDSDAKASKWTYISLSENKIMGAELISDDEGKITAWGARKDWDIAINRYKVRTNSGVVTSVNSQGGVVILKNTDKFDDIKKVPAAAQFAADKTVETKGHNNSVVIEKRSEAYVVLVSAGENGMKYDPSPVYIFRSADGKKYYKLLFTQYFDAESKSGHVKFKYAEIYM